VEFETRHTPKQRPFPGRITEGDGLGVGRLLAAQNGVSLLLAALRELLVLAELAREVVHGLNQPDQYLVDWAVRGDRGVGDSREAPTGQ